MESNKYNKLKIALILSFILNLSFISGFVIKKYVFSPGYKGTRSEQGKFYCEPGSHKTGYRHLSKKNPEFKKIFHIHRSYYRNTSNDLIKIKTRLLNELKKSEINKPTVDKLLREINRLTSELNEKNYQHLLSLRKLLDPKDFVSLLESMNNELGRHKEMHFNMEKDHFCQEDEK